MLDYRAEPSLHEVNPAHDGVSLWEPIEKVKVTHFPPQIISQSQSVHQTEEDFTGYLLLKAVTQAIFVTKQELWNCQSAVKKAYTISAYASLQTLQFLALTKTLITLENNATPAALSTAYSFSHFPSQTGRGGGTGLFISTTWSN